MPRRIIIENDDDTYTAPCVDCAAPTVSKFWLDARMGERCAKCKELAARFEERSANERHQKIYRPKLVGGAKRGDKALVRDLMADVPNVHDLPGD